VYVAFYQLVRQTDITRAAR